MSQTKSRPLVEAIWDDRLPQFGDPAGTAACNAIGESTGSEVKRVVDHLAVVGIIAEAGQEPNRPGQRHAAVLRVQSAADGLAAADHLAALGYQPWDPIQGPAGAVHRRFRSNLTMARTTDVTMVIDLRWRPPGSAGRFPAALIPNENDYETVRLPTFLWPLYFLIRPVRLVAERLRLRPRGAHQLGPFLGTPDSLVGPLLDVAGLTAEDTLVDLGCGDGRVVVAAASSIGCQAVGVENNPVLVEQARRRAAGAGSAGELVTIVNGDATIVTDVVDRGSVFFVFVPADAAVNLVADLLDAAKPGTRIVVHEQHRLLNEPPGATTLPVVTDNAITVAHRWTVT